jgi:hypothetical protein
VPKNHLRKKKPQPPPTPLERALKSLRKQVADTLREARALSVNPSAFVVELHGDEAVALAAEIDRLAACKDLLRELVEVAEANEFLMDLALLVRAKEALK